MMLFKVGGVLEPARSPCCACLPSHKQLFVTFKHFKLTATAFGIAGAGAGAAAAGPTFAGY
jgi:hypothetical protein